MAEQSSATLYARLGGYDAIAAVVDDFIGRLAGDKRFERFFAGFSDDSKKRLRQHILDQFCVAAGGPCVYMGRDMKTTHKGLGITEADWDVAQSIWSPLSISTKFLKLRRTNCWRSWWRRKRT